MSRFTRKYSMTWWIDQWEHQWAIVGFGGGAHLHIRPYVRDGITEYSAGLEMHFAAPPVYSKDKAPSHVPCWLIKVPCWHDGTSLYAQEYFVPLFRRGQPDHELIFGEMERWADGYLRPPVEP